MEFVLASNNQHKLEEFRKAFEPYDHIKIYSLNDLNIKVDPDETGKSFQENALIKANEVAKFTNKIVIADDSGLEIDALDGFPGIYSSRFMENKPYKEKFFMIQKMLENKENRNAHFTCVLAVVNLSIEPLYFEGKEMGEIIKDPKGKEGFGYDPIFFDFIYQKTFAECSQEEKNAVSHRGRAIESLLQFLKENNYI